MLFSLARPLRTSSIRALLSRFCLVCAFWTTGYFSLTKIKRSQEEPGSRCVSGSVCLRELGLEFFLWKEQWMGVIRLVNQWNLVTDFSWLAFMKSNSYRFLLKHTEGKTRVGLEQKVRFSVGLNSVSKNKLCLGGKYVAQKQYKTKQNKTSKRRTGDLWHFLYFVSEVIIQRAQGILQRPELVFQNQLWNWAPFLSSPLARHLV